MERSLVWSVSLLLALPAVVCAAEPGFYIGPTVSRVEQDLDERAGVGPIDIFVLDGVFVPAPAPSPILPFPPVVGVPVGGVFNPLGPSEVAVDDTDVGWSVTLGYRINRYLAAEVAYVDFGEASLTEYYRFVTIPEQPLPQITRSYTVSTRGPALSVLGSLPLGTAWEVFLRSGVLFADQEVTSRRSIVSAGSSSSGSTQGDFSDEVVTLGAGVQWLFLPRWAARLEYQRTDDLQRNNFMGESSLEQASLSVLFKL